MTDTKLTPFSTGLTPARYVALSLVEKDGTIGASFLLQQRVHHPIYSASSPSHVQAMQARLEKARRGAWGGKC